MSSIPNRWRLFLGQTLDWPRDRARTARLAATGWVVADQAVVSLSSFISAVIVGRACGQYHLGVYGLAVFLYWLTASIPNALVWTPYTSRAAHLPPARRAQFVGSVTLHALIISLAIAAVLLVVAFLPVPRLESADWFRPMCLALAPFAILMTLREHVRRITLADLKFRDLIRFDGPIAVVQLLLLAALAGSGALSASTALLAGAAASGGAILWILRRRSQFMLQPSLAAVHWSANFRSGRWLLVVSVLWLLGDSSYRWLVGELYGIEALGRFTAAFTIVLCLNPLLLTLNNVTQALASRRYAAGGAAELRCATKSTTLQVGAAAAVVFVCVALFGGTAVRWVFGEQYAGLGPVVATLCLGMFARVVAMPIDGAMVALRCGRTMAAAGAVRLLLIVGAGVPLIAWEGLVGAGYAMAIGHAAASVVQWSIFIREISGASR